MSGEQDGVEVVVIPFFKLESAGAKSAPLIKEMSFVGTKARIHAFIDLAIRSRDNERIRRMAANVSTVPLCVDIEGGAEWSDTLTPANSCHGLFVSERVVSDWTAAGIRGFEAIPRRIRKVNSKALKETAPEFYFEIRSSGRLRFTYRYYERVGEEYVFRFATEDPASEPRAQFMAEGYVQHLQLAPVPGSWDQADLIPVSDGRASFGRCFCSRRLVELAREKQWSNFSFAPIDQIGTWGGDFRSLPWPPERWYRTGDAPSVFLGEPDTARGA